MNKIDIFIDKLTPCLVELSTGKILPTTFSIATEAELKRLRCKGWLFDWSASELKSINIYKLLIKGSDVIQGLVATEVVRGAVYVRLLESAPHNRDKNKRYEGVGGHLFAIAIKLSIANKFGGYIYFEAKNEKLALHYSEMLGAGRMPSRIHEYRMELLEEHAQKIIGKYTLEGDFNDDSN